MHPEEQKRYNDLFDLFQTDGWRLFIRELSEQAEELDKIEGIKDSKELYFKQGQLSAIRSVISLEEVTDVIYKQTLESLYDPL